MLHVQKYLKAGKTLEDLTAELAIESLKHDSLPLVILNYNQIESPKTHPIVRECRGLVLRTDNFDLVARGFNRFFNWGEVADEMSHFDFGDFVVHSKEDGSLVLLYHFEGEWMANTRGSFGQWAMEQQEFTWQQAFCQALKIDKLSDLAGKLDESICYVCEFCSPYNKIVRRYEKPVMYLLTAFHGNKELHYKEVDAHTGMFLRPHRYEFDNIEKIQDFLNSQAETDPTYEGVVLCDKDGRRWKVKSATYLGLHRLKGEGENLFNPKHLLPFVLAGEDSELLTYFPEVRETYEELKSRVNAAYVELEAVFQASAKEVVLNRRSTMSNTPPSPGSQYFPLLIVFAAMILVLQFRPIHDTDIFWQRKLGSLTLEHGELVTREPFTSTHRDELIPPLCWLSQIIYAWLHSLGGWALMKQVDALLFAGSFLLVGLSLHRRLNPLGIALGMSLGFMVAIPHASLRPQTFAVFSFAALLSLLRMNWSWWKVVAIALVLVLWQNLHPSILVAIGVLGIRFLSALVQRDRLESQRFLLLLLIAAGATVATPCGFDLFRVSAYNASISRELGISEWLPLWDKTNWPASASAFVGLAIVGYLLIREYPNGSREDILVLLGLTVLFLSAARFAIFWGIAVVPVIAGIVVTGREITNVIGRLAKSYLLWTAVVITLAISLLLPRLLPTNLFSQTIPFRGIEHLQKLSVRGVIYTYAQWGGPLIDAGWPQWRVTYDGRYYVFSLEEWKQYGEEASGNVSLAEIEARYRPEAFFLHAKGQAGLIEQLRSSDRWRDVYSDGMCVVFIQQKH